MEQSYITEDLNVKAAAITLGCKVNQYESQAIISKLVKEGYEQVSSEEEADVYIVNSCSVTSESDRKTRQLVRKIKRQHPESIVVLTGCMSQAFPEEAAKLTEADIVTGNKFNTRIPEFIEDFRKNGRIVCVEEHKSGEPFCCDTVTSFFDRTRAEIKIEDGCNRFCSYCIIPYARGRVRSKPLDVLKAEASALGRAGYREIVLVGINLSAYGSDSGSSIVEAVKAAAECEGILRVRLGSLEPDHLTDAVINGLSEIDKLCPQFHISLQSGCNKTLKAMNRHYTAEEYSALCDRLRASFKDCTLTTDVMVGFADETDEDFRESLEFVKKIGFEKVHVFPYSRRKGTRADMMDHQVEKAVKEMRAAEMIAEADKIRRAFLSAQAGKILRVIPEEFNSKGCACGYTANYTPVLISEGECTCGEPVDVHITGTEGDFCTGRIISD